MRRTRPRLLLSFLLPLLAAACDDGGGAAPLAQPHELRLEIVRGKGMRDTVRASSEPADLLQADSVVVRVFAVLDADAGSTGPARDARIPPVEVAWRTLDPWCQPEHTNTPLGRGGTAANRLRVPTVAGDCRLVAEGVVNGFVFGADTAVSGFAPGPLASFAVAPLIAVLIPDPLDIRAVTGNARDEHGNLVSGSLPVKVTLTSGQPALTADDTLISASSEAAGTVTVRGGTASANADVWALQDLRGDWRLSWACYDADLAGGAHVDSAHYVMNPAEAAYGGVMSRGVAVRFVGTLAARTWVRGEPVRETAVPFTLRFALQRVGALEWPSGQTARPTATGYAGGSLCEPAPGGGAWARAAPVRVDPL